MKRLLVLLLLSATAHAAPITPPAGWTLDPTLGGPPATAPRFAGASTKVTVYGYRPASPGAVLYVNRAEAEVPAADRDRLATIELDEPRNALRRQPDAKAEQDSQRFDAAKKQLEAIVKWRDAVTSMIDSSRVVIAGDATKLVAVTGQCLFSGEATPDAQKGCEDALVTLDPELPVDGRVALAIVATETEPPPKPAHDVLDDGGKMSLPPIVVSQPATEPDRRPVYLGLGIVVLAAIFWWNRKRREKFEEDHPQEVPRDVPKATARQKSRDEDADALHSAAEAGDDPENKQ